MLVFVCEGEKETNGPNNMEHPKICNGLYAMTRGSGQPTSGSLDSLGEVIRCQDGTKPETAHITTGR